LGLSPGRHSSTEREQDKTQSTATRRKPPDDSGAGSFGINLDDVLDDDIRAGLPVIICARWVLVISGLSLTHDPSFSQGLPLFGCFFGTFSPSRRHMRSTLLWFTCQPRSLGNAVILR
jgi:hypothetical protein